MKSTIDEVSDPIVRGILERHEKAIMFLAHRMMFPFSRVESDWAQIHNILNGIEEYEPRP